MISRQLKPRERRATTPPPADLPESDGLTAAQRAKRTAADALRRHKDQHRRAAEAKAAARRAQIGLSPLQRQLRTGLAVALAMITALSALWAVWTARQAQDLATALRDAPEAVQDAPTGIAELCVRSWLTGSDDLAEVCGAPTTPEYYDAVRGREVQVATAVPVFGEDATYRQSDGTWSVLTAATLRIPAPKNRWTDLGIHFYRSEWQIHDGAWRLLALPKEVAPRVPANVTPPSYEPQSALEPDHVLIGEFLRRLHLPDQPDPSLTPYLATGLEVVPLADPNATRVQILGITANVSSPHALKSDTAYAVRYAVNYGRQMVLFDRTIVLRTENSRRLVAAI